MHNNKEYLKIIKTISNERRKEIILLLVKNKKEMCVNEISSKLNMSQSLTSHQLKYLENRDIICGTRMGQVICYELCRNGITKKIIKVIKFLME